MLIQRAVDREKGGTIAPTASDDLAKTKKVMPKASEDIEERLVEIEKYPVKAQKYLKRAEGKLAKVVGEALSVPAGAKREGLKDIARSISTEYFRSGTISPKVKDEMFGKAYEEGVMVIEDFYNEHKELKERLRKTESVK